MLKCLLHGCKVVLYLAKQIAKHSLKRTQVVANISVIRSFNAQNSQTAIMDGWLHQYFKNTVQLSLGYAAYLVLY